LTYHDARAVLADQLPVRPGPPLHQQILPGDPALDPPPAAL
jgi:hypothetical protein